VFIVNEQTCGGTGSWYPDRASHSEIQLVTLMRQYRSAEIEVRASACPDGERRQFIDLRLSDAR
jgi:hypothetical protein